MLEIILRAGSFIAIIVMGFILRRIGFFKEQDFDILAKICIRITLPCAIITSFSGKTIEPALLMLPVMALACGAIYIALGYVMNRGKDRESQAFSMLNLAGYNIGTFVIPFAQSFLGPMGVVAVSIFDTGNAVICLGGGYSVASMVKDGGGFSTKRLLRSLGTPVPCITYMTMLAMNLLHLGVPGFGVGITRACWADDNRCEAAIDFVRELYTGSNGEIHQQLAAGVSGVMGESIADMLLEATDVSGILYDAMEGDFDGWASGVIESLR